MSRCVMYRYRYVSVSGYVRVCIYVGRYTTSSLLPMYTCRCVLNATATWTGKKAQGKGKRIDNECQSQQQKLLLQQRLRR